MIKLGSDVESAVLVLFPFAVEFSDTGRILDAGPSIRRLVPNLVGTLFLEAFRVRRPHLCTNSISELLGVGRRLLILSLMNSQDCIVRGNLVASAREGVYWFIGSVWIRSYEEFERTGLEMGDFGPADAVLDVIHMMSNHELTLKDADALIKEIYTHKRVLRERASLLQKTSDFIVQLDQRGTVLFWNSAAERISGILAANAQGKCFQELLGIPPATWGNCTTTILHEGIWSGDLRIHRRDGKQILLDATMDGVFEGDEQACHSILMVATDITQRRIQNQSEARNQRLESIGTLAGGIAHDLNNALSPVVIGLDLLHDRIAKADVQLLEDIAAAVDRCTSMVQHLVAFARGIESERLVTAPAVILNDLERDVSATFPKNIALQFSCTRLPWSLRCDPVQIHQVLLNLCINARDAMPEGGALNVRCESIEIEEASELRCPDQPPGPYLLFIVEDTGDGMNDEVRDRVFEPFFTTKEVGKGTGLGLSVTLGIIKEHRGFINLATEPGRGTRFFIYLPAEYELELDASSVRAPKSWSGAGHTVLLVEDELSVRRALRAVLEHSKCRVLEAESGAVALETFAKHEEDIDIVVTDYMMPGMDGIGLILALQAFRRAPPVILLSGIDVDDRLEPSMSEQVFCVLRKPVTMQKLLEMVKRALSPSDEAEIDWK